MSNVKKGATVRIAGGWEGDGKIGTALGEPIEVSGISWTPVLWHGEEDPDWFKTVGLWVAKWDIVHG